MKYNFKDWIRAAGIRSLKTIAQVAAAQLAVETGIGIGQIDWVMVGSVSLLAGILSLLTSIAGLPELERPVHEDNTEEY